MGAVFLYFTGVYANVWQYVLTLRELGGNYARLIAEVFYNETEKGNMPVGIISLRYVPMLTLICCNWVGVITPRRYDEGKFSL